MGSPDKGGLTVPIPLEYRVSINDKVVPTKSSLALYIWHAWPKNANEIDFLYDIHACITIFQGGKDDKVKNRNRSSNFFRGGR